MYQSEANYYNDSRVRGGQRANQQFIVFVNDSDSEVELPTKTIVCPTCNGHGKHVNPSIDCDGLTAEDFDNDPDFRGDYLRGTYDVTCYECGGRNVVKSVDEDACGPELLKLWHEQQYEIDAERRMGA